MSDPLFDLTGKVAVLTGASKGMGKALAEGLALAGARVVVSSRKIDVCEATAAEINELCGSERAIPVACNIGYKEQLQNLVDVTHDRLGSIDILVCNAGVNPFFGPSAEIPDSAFDKTMNSNVKSNHWLCHMVLPDMVEKRDGVIVVTSSNGGFMPSTHLGAYAISKAADLALVRNLAAEYGPFNIRVNALCPGLFKTDFSAALWQEDGKDKPADYITLQRFGDPEELRGVVVFLASRAASYMTGQALIIDGGQVMVR
ncbi:MAG: glucose 1-dehydrogenase [Gammaproteobacteria bacterium]|nr:glucose 1-dehydrogenase [Gammaproteobacteria bacterium]